LPPHPEDVHGYPISLPRHTKSAHDVLTLTTEIAASAAGYQMTETKLKFIAAAAIIGLNRIPKNG
jgi:hypothetical protein